MTKKIKILLTGCHSCSCSWCWSIFLSALGNQSIQADVSERQQIIGQTMQLETLNRQLINVLANLAMKTNDEPLMEVLAAAGINSQAGHEGRRRKMRHPWTTKIITTLTSAKKHSAVRR